MLAASAVEDRPYLALAVVERDRSLERFLRAEVSWLDFPAEVETALAPRCLASRFVRDAEPHHVRGDTPKP